jgi:hypothetical protein
MSVYTRTEVVKGLIVLAAWLVFTVSPRAEQAAVRRVEMTIASKRTKDLVVTITNADGRLRGGENSFCVVFNQRAEGKLAVVRNVRANFILLVGRIREEPIKGRLTQDRANRYCGQVNLGKQYYEPASYYAFVFYTDASGKKRKTRLFVTVKRASS